MAILTSDQAKTYLGITGAQDDAWFSLMVPLVEDDVARQTRRSFSGVEATELFDGEVVNLYLPRLPVSAVAEVRDAFDIEDDAAGAVVDATLYQFDGGTGQLWLRDDVAQGAYVDPNQPHPPAWGKGRRRWKVKYTAGYGTVPPIATAAALLIIAARWHRRDAGTTAESLGDASTQHDNHIPPEALRLLEKITTEVFA